MPITLRERQAKTLSILEKRLEELPVLPFVISRIATADTGSSDFVSKLEELSRLDPPFGMRLMQLANSAGAGAREPIVTLPAAFSRIGAKQLAEAVTTLSVARVFAPRTVGQKNLWIHSIQVAVAARSLAMMVPELKTPPETAYLAGLLHDIGRFVLYNESVEQLGAVDELGPLTAEDLILAEKKICGFDHAQLGYHACKQWGLPHLIETFVKEHHTYSDIKNEPSGSELFRLIRLLQLADRLSFVLLTEQNLNQKSDAYLDKLLENRCLPAMKWIVHLTRDDLRILLRKTQKESDLLVHQIGFN